jgi:hypothetical protein
LHARPDEAFIMNRSALLTQMPLILGLFAAGLIVSGVTAIFPPEGLKVLSPFFAPGSILQAAWPAMASWLNLVRSARQDT